ncbi:FAD-dependent monooxygenase [Mycetocola sp.]|uniref:FAD-dependent monooxygenase n=1 Tax=Mycetocola sp. TaxID=1871042 RepID=UPI003989358E
MTQAPWDFDFVVVGAGPVGLTAAALLSESGASVLVIEKSGSTSNEPKAISIDDEALRTYSQAGLAQKILSLVVPGTGTAYYGADGNMLFSAGAEVPYRLGFPFKNPFAQPELELLLVEELRKRPHVTLTFGACLSGLESSERDIRASYTSARGTETVHARFLLGADGGRSTVRSLLGITMSGRAHDEDWLVVDTLRDAHVERFGMHHGNPGRPHVIVPGLNGRCRYEFRLFEGEGKAGELPDFSLLQKVLAPYRNLDPADIDRAVIYRFNGLIADDWQVGSSFLLGDAAHMMPPFAGQGLNSGIRDAANLCWKLIAVAGGRAPAQILASYQAERFTHARATIRLSERLGRVVMTTSPRLAAFRDRTVAQAITTKAGRDFFQHMRYRPSPRFTCGLLAPTPGAPIGLPIGQPRCFDTSNSAVSLLDDQTGSGWALFRIEEFERPWPRVLVDFAGTNGIRTFDVPLTEIFPRTSSADSALIDVDGRLTAEFEPYRGRYVLVRPDHVVAAAWLPDELNIALFAIRKWWLPVSELARER